MRPKCDYNNPKPTKVMVAAYPYAGKIMQRYADQNNQEGIIRMIKNRAILVFDYNEYIKMLNTK